MGLRHFNLLVDRWVEEVEARGVIEKNASHRTGVLLATILNVMPGVSREGGGEFRPSDFFGDLPEPEGRKEQTPEDMLAVMKANSQFMDLFG